VGDRLFVVVPCLDEAMGIGPTLDALASQSDRDFALIFVDNGSRDETRAALAAFIDQHSDLDIEVIDEPEKGTGAASDTGFRRAAARGATENANVATISAVTRVRARVIIGPP